MNPSHAVIEATVAIVMTLFVAAAVIATPLLIMSAHKASIASAVKQLGATPVSIHWWPTLWGNCDTHYNVTLQFLGQHPCSVMCQCSLWRGVYWKDAPWLGRPFPSPPLPASSSTCPACGYPLQPDWRRCPKCEYVTT